MTECDLHQSVSDPYKEPEQQLVVRLCNACGKFILWADDLLVYPTYGTVPAPNHDLPQRMRDLYAEAALVFGASPRSAAALLRLAIQELCLELGYTQRDLKKQLERLAEDHNLDDRITQALHIVRVVGNNAVHPGQINIDDTPNLTASLFLLINEIGDELYTKPKRIQELWNSLPEGARSHVKLRETSKPTP